MLKAVFGKSLILILLFLSFVLSSCVPVNGVSTQSKASPGLLGAVLQKKVLVIATDADYPPQSALKANEPRAANTLCDLSSYTANQFTGFDVDVGVEIARRLGVEPCFVTPTWTQIVAGNWGDRWDVSIGSMVITQERMQVLYFTQPYISGGAVLFLHKDNQTYTRPEDLSGKRVGVCVGCAYEAYLHGSLIIPGEKIEYQIKNATAVGYDTDTSALAALAEGDGIQVDAVMTDPDTGSEAIRSGLPIKQMPGYVYHDYSGVAVDKKSIQDPIPLVQKLTAIIQEMHKDGTLLRFSEKYYNGDFTTPASYFDIHAVGQYP